MTTPPGPRQDPAGEQPYGGLRPASMGTRCVARLVDALVLGVPFLAVYILLVTNMVTSARVDPATGELVPTAGSIGAVFAFAMFGLVASVLYEVGLVATRGATVGKKVMHVKVVRQADDSLPGWGPAVLRYLIPLTGSLVCGIGQILVYLSPLFDSSKRNIGWHDAAAKTWVVDAR